MTPEEIRQEICRIEYDEVALERRRQDLDKKRKAIQAKCPHLNMRGAQYTRWCADCGESWDTT